MITIQHISDLHIGPPSLLPIKLLDRSPKSFKFLKKLKNEWDKHENHFRYLMITGDLANDGTKSQYRRIRKQLLPFTGRLLLVPGNHDYGTQGSGFSEKKVGYFTEYLSPLMAKPHIFVKDVEKGLKQPLKMVLQDDHGTVVHLWGLDSCLLTKNIDDFAKGQVGTFQLETLKNELVHIPSNEFRFVFLHHRPTKEGIPKETMTLTDRDDLMKILCDHVDIVAFGHQGLVEDEMSKPHSGISSPSLINYHLIDGLHCSRLRHCLNADDSVDQETYFNITFDVQTGCLVNQVSLK